MDWCEGCGWNLAPRRPASGEGRFAAFAAALSGRSAVPGARVLAVAIAVSVLLFDVALIVAGVAAVVAEPTNPIAVVLGLTLVSLGVLMRPRVPGRPEGAVLDPALTPTLHRLVADVAAARGVPAPRGIVVNADWNAAWAVAGVRRRRWLVLGLPLLTALEPRERVAVIAHEVGHEDAGDLTRTFVVGSAVRALDALADVMRPPPADTMLADWVTRPLLWLLSRPVDALLWLEARLLSTDLQRAEHVADVRAADIAGAAAVIALLERLLLLDSTVELAVQRHALAGGRAEEVLGAVRAALDGLPERERERRRRIARLEQTRLIDTHPPIGRRIETLEQRPPQSHRVSLDGWTSARIDDELAPLEPAVGRALIDGYQSSLYSG